VLVSSDVLSKVRANPWLRFSVINGLTAHPYEAQDRRSAPMTKVGRFTVWG
jgi:hypothetical protein